MSTPFQSPQGSVNSATSLIRDLLKAMDEYSKSLGEELEVNPTDLKVMEHLIENGPMTPTELARAVGVTSGALTQSLDRLEKVGHTTRQRSTADRRSVEVVANPASVGRAWKRIQPLITESEKMLAGMNKTEQEAVERYLSGMISAYKNAQ